MPGQESLRAAGSRDKGFLGLDIIAMAHLIQQMNSASDAISGWLRTNATLPPSVPRTGLRQAAAVETWVNGQPGMLARRRNYAVTHLGAGGRSMPRVGVKGPGARRRTTTPVGAGHQTGHFPDVRTAMRAGSSDATAVQQAGREHHAISPAIWKRLLTNADDPDYAHGLYKRLGPAGAAELIKAALAGKDHLKAVETSLGVASHQMAMNDRWLRALLDEAAREGIRDDAVRVLGLAGLNHRSKVALDHSGLHVAAGPAQPAPPAHTLPSPTHASPPPVHTPPGQAAHLFPVPDPPHTTPAADHRAVITAADPPAASDPYANGAGA